MKHWEEYYYELDKSYNEEELKQIKILLNEARIINSIFIPLFSMLTIGLINLCILSIILYNKNLDIASLIVFIIFLVVCFLWGFFKYKNSKKRITLMKSLGNKNKKTY